MKSFTVIVSFFVALAVSSTHSASLHRSRRQVVPKEFANINIENYLKVSGVDTPVSEANSTN
jgi:hypothetical protein